MKPSEQLKKINLSELEAQLNQACDEESRYKEKYTRVTEEIDKITKQKEQMLKAIEELESKGL